MTAEELVARIEAPYKAPESVQLELLPSPPAPEPPDPGYLPHVVVRALAEEACKAHRQFALTWPTTFRPDQVVTAVTHRLQLLAKERGMTLPTDLRSCVLEALHGQTG